MAGEIYLPRGCKSVGIHLPVFGIASKPDDGHNLGWSSLSLASLRDRDLGRFQSHVEKMAFLLEHKNMPRPCPRARTRANPKSRRGPARWGFPAMQTLLATARYTKDSSERLTILWFPFTASTPSPPIRAAFALELLSSLSNLLFCLLLGPPVTIYRISRQI